MLKKLTSCFSKLKEFGKRKSLDLRLKLAQSILPRTKDAIVLGWQDVDMCWHSILNVESLNPLHKIQFEGISQPSILKEGLTWFDKDKKRICYSPDGQSVIKLDPPAKVYDLIRQFGMAHYSVAVCVEYDGERVVPARVWIFYQRGGVIIPKTLLNLTKLYAYIQYYLYCVATGVTRIYFRYGTDTILIDEIVNPSETTSRRNAKWIDLSPYLKDDWCEVWCDIAGDGIHESRVCVEYIYLVGISE